MLVLPQSEFGLASLLIVLSYDVVTLHPGLLFGQSYRVFSEEFLLEIGGLLLRGYGEGAVSVLGDVGLMAHLLERFFSDCFVLDLDCDLCVAGNGTPPFKGTLSVSPTWRNRHRKRVSCADNLDTRFVDQVAKVASITFYKLLDHSLHNYVFLCNHCY